MPPSDQKFTRCPGCQTVFRVTAEQLALRNGQVRCGHCRTVFDGQARLISLAAPVAADVEADHDDLGRGPPTVTLRDSRALEAAPAVVAPAQREPEFAAEPPGMEEATPTDAKESPPISAHVPPAASDDADSSADAPPIDVAAAARRARLRHFLYVAAIPLLVVAFAAQALLHFRDAVAARWPGSRPVLARICDVTGCMIRPPRDIAGLSIDASDLQADPAHKGLLILTATVRNRAALPLAYPMLELTLTDASDHVVVRRALAPTEYAAGTADLAGGIPANTEVLVKMFIDASATTQAGYRLYLFYP